MAKKPGKYYLRAAEKSGKITLRQGKGDHVKMYGIDPKTGRSEMMICPENLKGNGTEAAIIKWLVRMGVALLIIILLLIVFGV